jgi:hypothetical protein
MFLNLALACALAKSFLAGPNATLTGRVTDTVGEVIAGVRVEVTNTETNVVFSGETNEAGLYIVPNLPPGTYRVILQKFAFRTVTMTDVELHAQDIISLSVSMELGSVVQSITFEGGAPLIDASPARGGNFLSREVRGLPLVSLSPLSLARMLPGVAVPAGSTVYTTLPGGAATMFSVNGQRLRGNNYLLDSTENNDIAFTGVAQPFDIADAVEEISVETGNSGVEFGRATGGVFNVITKSGTNDMHGTLLWRYQSHRFNSVSNMDKLNRTPQAPFNWNVYGFTLGGPVRRGKTFFFGAFQGNRVRYDSGFPLVVPTEATARTLVTLFPDNPRLDLYLGLLGGLRGSANPFVLPLGKDPLTGIDRGVAEFASATQPVHQSGGGPQWMIRMDHNFSEVHRLAFRYVQDSRMDSPVVGGGSAEQRPASVYFPGFVTDRVAQNQNALFIDQYSLSPAWTNELRFSYARQNSDTRRISPQSVPLAWTLPRINFPPVDSPGVPPHLLSYRRVQNLLVQDTQTYLKGRHTYRYGVEFLRQLADQFPDSYTNGNIVYSAAAGYSAFANFLDDFSGPSGNIRKNFDATVFHPDQFHQTYFFQDAWLPAPSLSLTLGLRYENFGQPANALRYPAFSGFDPEKFFEPNRVNTDNNNFGPSFGLAWSPSFRSGWLGKLFGEGSTVWRGGFQISYDAFFTQMISLLMATSPPNELFIEVMPSQSGRGETNWSAQLPVESRPISLLDPQRGALETNFRSPYTERWSLGFQRQLSSKLLLEGSYVGSESHKLTTWESANPLMPDGQRLHPDFGVRDIRTSQGNSAYHAMQWRVERRFSRRFQGAVSYTWSRSIDSTSEGVGAINEQTLGANRTWIPIAQGGLKLDRGRSDFDRTHALTLSYLWAMPGPSNGSWKHVLGGWSLAGITSFQSGAPFTVHESGPGPNRPDISNPNASLNSRGVLDASCPTGYRNPDTNSCVSRADVHWVQSSHGLPNPSSVGRNTLQTGGINNFDVRLSKFFQLGEQRRLEFSWEAFNALNHPQYTQVPERSVVSSAPSRFLNRDFTNSGIRTMWVQVKLIF